MKDAVEWYETHFDRTQAWEEIHGEVICLLRGLFPRGLAGLTVLDAGCGCGTLLSRLYRKDVCFLGIDISLSALKISANNGIEVIRADMQHMPIKDDAFDIGISTEVLEHVMHPELALEELIRVTKNTAVVTTPLSESIIEILDRKFCSILDRVSNALRGYSLSQPLDRPLSESSLMVLVGKMNVANIETRRYAGYRVPILSKLGLFRIFERSLQKSQLFKGRCIIMALRKRVM